MKYRKQRVAWSVVWGIVCLLLIALWVRSYSYADTFATSSKAFTSWQGWLFLGGNVHVEYHDYDDRDVLRSRKVRSMLGVYLLSTMDHGNITYIGGSSLPITALLVLMGIVTAVPWLRWRFSLRTLLIAITVVAVMLGWAVYTLRQ